MSTSSLDYDFQTRRLALGLEFEDFLREALLVYPVRVEIEYSSPHQTPVPANTPFQTRAYAFEQAGSFSPYGLMRSASGRYSLSYFPDIKPQIDLRVYDYDRYYIPRRLRIPLRTLAEVINIENNEVPDYLNGRIRHLTMFPGAAYHSAAQVTGLRGRVVRDGEPMRWAYVSARLPLTGNVIARTRGDDRGEFLLILPPEAAPASDLTAQLDIDVSIAGPASVPVPGSAGLPEQDPWWDLPIEELPPIGAVDEVSNGSSVPLGYVTALSTLRTIQFSVGRLLTGRDEVDFEFALP